MRSAQMEQTQNARGSDMLKHSRGIRRDERRPRERTPTRNARQMFQKRTRANEPALLDSLGSDDIL